MSFKLENVVPWGRNLNEYKLMFRLDNKDISSRIAGFGDGPASFNYQATQEGYCITSFDPIYQFTKAQLEKRIGEVRTIVMKQMEENQENYVWNNIKSLNELEQLRMSAMKLFLADYEKGKKEKRYIYHELPQKLPYADNHFDIGLSSHFLFLYTALGYDFHIQAIMEMLRVCKEVRIFPILDLDAQNSKLTAEVMTYFKKKSNVEIWKTEYEFQKGGNQLLVIRK